MRKNSLQGKEYNQVKHRILVGIIDYNVGNVSSVSNAVSRLGFNWMISKDEKLLQSCTHLILPGVGAFDNAYKQLELSGLISFLKKAVFENKIPILGICVGMQLMLESSTENGIHKGLGWVKGNVEEIETNGTLKLPHVGWNNIKIKNDTLFRKVLNGADFYFDHSYYCKVDTNCITSTVRYKNEFAASFKKDLIFGVQFHPEKSQINGLRVFKSFLNQI